MTLKGVKLQKEVLFQVTECYEIIHILFPYTQLQKKMWSLFEYTPSLNQEGQKKEEPYFTLNLLSNLIFIFPDKILGYT